MKTITRKRWLAILMIFLTLSFTFTAVQKSRSQAVQAGVVIGVLVVVAGGVVVYDMWNWCKVHIPPPTPPSTNNAVTNVLSGTYQIDHFGAQDPNGVNYDLLGEEWGSLSPYTHGGSGPWDSSTVMTMMAQTKPLIAPLIGGLPVIIEMGLDNSNVPTLAISNSTNILSPGNTPFGAPVYEQAVGPQGVSVGICGNVLTWKPGPGSNCFNVYYAWSTTSTNLGKNWSSGGFVWSNADGDTVTISSPRVPTNEFLTLQKSTDMKNWSTITSTQAVSGSAFLFTDTNASPSAFYRTFRNP